jgi:hypothetical protein
VQLEEARLLSIIIAVSEVAYADTNQAITLLRSQVHPFSQP